MENNQLQVGDIYVHNGMKELKLKILESNLKFCLVENSAGCRNYLSEDYVLKHYQKE